MKNFLLFLSFMAFTMSLNAQSDYDCIGRNEFYLLKTGSNLKSASVTRAFEIKSSKVAEKQLGTNYVAKRQFAETKNEYYYKMEYEDGLELRIPEDQRLDIDFHIKSDKYILKLTNGQTIKVGMNSKDLKSIFPKSFSKRQISDKYGKTDKVALIVYFSQIYDNKVLVEDSWIAFILSGENGILEEFYTVEPS
jgi:hypothetical protein